MIPYQSVNLSMSRFLALGSAEPLRTLAFHAVYTTQSIWPARENNRRCTSYWPPPVQSTLV